MKEGREPDQRDRTVKTYFTDRALTKRKPDILHDPAQGSLLAQLLDCVPFHIYLYIFNPVALFLSVLEFRNVVVLGKYCRKTLEKVVHVCACVCMHVCVRMFGVCYGKMSIQSAIALFFCEDAPCVMAL